MTSILFTAEYGDICDYCVVI